MVLHGLDGRLLVQHEGRSIATQEAPPSPVLQRTITGSSPDHHRIITVHRSARSQRVDHSRDGNPSQTRYGAI